MVTADHLQSLARKALAPIFVTVELTRRCNLNCDHCYVDHHIKDQLTVAQLDRLFSEISRAGGLFLGLTGGEIGLRKDLHEIVAAARSYHFNIRLLSTATLFSDPDLERLAALGVRQVKVSVYSDQAEIHDGIVRVKGAFDKSVRSIRKLRELGVEVVMQCPIMSTNGTELTRMIALAKRLDCKVAIDTNIRPMEDGTTDPCSLRLTAGQLATVFDNPDVAEAVLDSRYENGPVPAPSSDEPVCNAGRSLCFIDSRGELYPCLTWRESAGNVLSDGFLHLWQTAPIFGRARNLVQANLSDCGGCGDRGYCSPCPGIGHSERGDHTLAASAVCTTTAATKLYFQEIRHGRSFADPGVVHRGQLAGRQERLRIIS